MFFGNTQNRLSNEVDVIKDNTENIVLEQGKQAQNFIKSVRVNSSSDGAAILYYGDTPTPIEMGDIVKGGIAMLEYLLSLSVPRFTTLKLISSYLDSDTFYVGIVITEDIALSMTIGEDNYEFR